MSQSTVDKLTSALGAAQVAADDASREARRHDYWMVSHVRDLVGTPADKPLCVVRPRHVEDVQATLRIANATGTPVVPFGLGSGVVGGVIPGADAILLDM